MGKGIHSRRSVGTWRLPKLLECGRAASPKWGWAGHRQSGVGQKAGSGTVTSASAFCPRLPARGSRLLWNECAQLTLISARDFNVTDASRTMRARFYGQRFSIFPQGCIFPLPASELSEMTCRDSLPSNRSCFVVIGTHTLRIHNSCTSRSSREYGPPRVLSQRSEDCELSMNNVCILLFFCFFFINNFTETLVSMPFPS